MGHIKIGNSAKQMIKSKAYMGIYEHHDHVKFYSDSFPIVMDTGASCAISIKINDFIELDKHEDTIHGLRALRGEGKGTLRWTILNDEN